MEEINAHSELIELRKRKIQELIDLGHDPYNDNISPTARAQDIHDEYDDKDGSWFESENKVQVTVCGRIIAFRGFGKAAFAQLQDGSDRKIQLYLSKDILGDKYQAVKKVDMGDIIGASGTLFKTKTGELTIEVDAFRVLTKSLRPLPEKWHGLKDVEIRYRQRYVDLIVNPEVRKTFALRSKIMKSFRDYLEQHDFIEVETPMMHPIPGGAAARPFSTYHNALDMELYLRIAPELYLKRLLVGGYERVYEINRNFRNEGISTKHNPEFTMLEFYVAYKDYEFLMDFTESFLGHVTTSALGTLKFTYGQYDIDFTPPWKRIGFIDALKEAGVPEDVVADEQSLALWARDKGIFVPTNTSYTKLLDEVFKELVEPNLIQPTFIIDYPVELSPLARRKKSNPALTDRFELFVAAREIANAFSELNDPIDQKQRFLSQLKDKEMGDDEAHAMDDDFVRALEYGMPPAAGEGIGIDRVVMLLTNSASIRDVILFPLLKAEQ